MQIVLLSPPPPFSVEQGSGIIDSLVFVNSPIRVIFPKNYQKRLVGEGLSFSIEELILTIFNCLNKVNCAFDGCFYITLVYFSWMSIKLQVRVFIL